MKTKALAAIPARTVIGPVTESHVVKILDEYGVEVAICFNNLQTQGHVLRCDIQRD